MWKFIEEQVQTPKSFYFSLQSRVIAVLDWELSTIGHPLSDLAHLSLFYFCPRTLSIVNQGSYFQENIGMKT